MILYRALVKVRANNRASWKYLDVGYMFQNKKTGLFYLKLTKNRLVMRNVVNEALHENTTQKVLYFTKVRGGLPITENIYSGKHVCNGRIWVIYDGYNKRPECIMSAFQHKDGTFYMSIDEELWHCL